MTGGDIVTARFLHKEYFEFTPQFKLWISGNYKPVLGEDHGIWRRVILIPFEVTFDEDTRDDQLENKLLKELPGILNWAIKGCINWQNQSLKSNPPKKIADGTPIYGGSVVKVAGEFNPFYTQQVGVGVQLRMNAVQVIELVQGGGSSGDSFGFGGEEGGYVAEDVPPPAVAAKIEDIKYPLHEIEANEF